jgi:hypothetical protein
MSAETLREAARLMRERAEAATPGPWRFTDSEAVNDVWDGGMVVVSTDADPIANVLDEWYEPDPGEPAPINDAEHIASWHPAVALAVADALDLAANLAPPDPHHGNERCETCGWVSALASVARAYLGEQP